jgi:hypothetical protein
MVGSLIFVYFESLLYLLAISLYLSLEATDFSHYPPKKKKKSNVPFFDLLDTLQV